MDCIIKVRYAYIDKVFFVCYNFICIIEIIFLLHRVNVVFFFQIKSQNICEKYMWKHMFSWGLSMEGSDGPHVLQGFNFSLFSVFILHFLLKQSIQSPSFNYNWKLCIEDLDPCVLDNWWISVAEVAISLLNHLFLPLPSVPPSPLSLCLGIYLFPFPITLKNWLVEKRWGAFKNLIS